MLQFAGGHPLCYTVDVAVDSQELLNLLHAHALRSKSANVDLRAFIASLVPIQAAPREILSAVQELSASGAFTLYSDSEGPRTVVLADFSLMSLIEEYRRLSTDASLPFPREDTAAVAVEAADITPVDVMSQMGLLMETQSDAAGIAKLLFPGDVPPLLVPRSCVGTLLLDAAVLRIGNYLQQSGNPAFVESKLAPSLRGSELLVRQCLDDLIHHPKKATAAIFTPPDFSFRFWTQLCSTVLQDVGEKMKPTEIDHGICQSAWIINCAVLHRKAELQREAEKAADKKALEQRMRKAPFLFSVEGLYDLTDEKGYSYAVKHGRSFILAFLAEKTHKEEEDELPTLVRLHEETRKMDYVILRDMIVPVFLNMLAEAAESLQQGYIESWTAAMKSDLTPQETENDALFKADVAVRLRERFPLLALLANGDILFTAMNGPFVTEDSREVLARCFFLESMMRPYHELLGLSRLSLLRAARANLPFWQTVPIIRGIVRLFRRLFVLLEQRELESKRRRPPEIPLRSSGDEAPADFASTRSMGRSRSQLRSLLALYVPQGKTVDMVLKELSERWHPLFEEAQKQDLVDNVNAFVRDMLRPIRRSVLNRPVDRPRIRAVARQIAESSNLSKIRNRDQLIRYIELYVIKSLLAE